MITKVSSELRAGDVVNCYGMRCLIDRAINRRHSPRGGQEFVYFTSARVLNRDQVDAISVPLAFTTVYDNHVATGEHRWTIQGNDNARWSVES